MNREKAISIITKTLALARDNPSLQEAETALLKAQELMARYSIEESELEAGKEELNGREVVHEEVTTWGRTPFWKSRLARIISENFRCMYYKQMGYGKSQIRFVGFKEEVEVAKDMYLFAERVLEHSVASYLRKKRKEFINKGIEYQFDSTGLRNQFILGFLKGLEDKFKEQVDKNGWGLVIVAHALVQQEMNTMSLRTVSTGRGIRRSNSKDAYNSGYSEGKSLSKHTQIGGN